MDPKIAQQIIEDAAELLTKTAELQEENQALIKKGELDNQKIAELEQAAAASRARVKQAAEGAAARLVERGSLDASKVAQFVSLIENDPAQAIAVMEKIALESTAQQIGSPSGEDKTAGAATDPIAAFAMS